VIPLTGENTDEGEGWCLPGSEAVWRSSNSPKISEKRSASVPRQSRASPGRKVSRTDQRGFPTCSEEGGGHSSVTLINFYQTARCGIPDAESIL